MGNLESERNEIFLDKSIGDENRTRVGNGQLQVVAQITGRGVERYRFDAIYRRGRPAIIICE